ncbi:MAG: ABC transporter permease subunit [Candidatus Dadabacteria bacterium]|nr:MAG: ABC transporter permease subunit [Candidatus Dadabacteria bacterium]
MSTATGRYKDVLLSLFAFGSTALILILAASIVARLLPAMQSLNLDFILKLPENGGRGGGIYPVIVSTVLILIISLLTALPFTIGVLYYSFINRHRNSVLLTLINTCIDLLASTPSIVFGLAGYAFFGVYLGFGYSILTGAFTLAVMVLPFLIRLSLDSIHALPEDYTLNSAALGLSTYTAFFRIIVPAAFPALVVAFVLGSARALSETAALLFTSGYSLRMPESIFDPGRTISVHIYDLAMNVPGGEQNAYKSAAILLLLILVIDGLSQFLMKKWREKGLCK